MRKVDQCPDEMKPVEKNLLRQHVGRDGMSWEELTWFEMRWSANVKCEVGVWRVQCEVWRKCSLGVAFHRSRAQVMFLDNNSATGSHKARTHGPGWRTAHASSILPPRLVRVLLVYLMFYWFGSEGFAFWTSSIVTEGFPSLARRRFSSSSCLAGIKVYSRETPKGRDYPRWSSNQSDHQVMLECRVRCSIAT